MSAAARSAFPLLCAPFTEDPPHSVGCFAPGRSQSRNTTTNGAEGEVFASNVFSEVKGRFDMIISNPPFHDGMQTSLDAAQTLIRGGASPKPAAASCDSVANAFPPYPTC